MVNEQSGIKRLPPKRLRFSRRDIGKHGAAARPGDRMKIDIMRMKTRWMIGKRELYHISLAHAQKRPRHLFVVGPIIKVNPWCCLPDHFLCLKRDTYNSVCIRLLRTRRNSGGSG